MLKTPNHIIILLTAVALFALAPLGDALAAGPPNANTLFGMATPDAPIQWLQNMIQGSNAPGGGAEPFLTSYGVTNNNGGNMVQAGLQAVLSWYSYAMLVIGSFLLLYYLVRIIAETAHTGRPGGRANQLWAPIRTVLAIGLLVPLSTGLNSGQMIVLNLASEGSALASNTWALFVKTFTSNIANGSDSLLSAPETAGAQDQAVYNTFLVDVCVDAWNTALTNAGMAAADGALGQPSNWAVTGDQSSMPPNGTVVMYGNGRDQQLCGQIQSQTQTTTVSDTNLTNQTTDKGTAGNIQTNNQILPQSVTATLAGAIINGTNSAFTSNVQSTGGGNPSGPVATLAANLVQAVVAGQPIPAGMNAQLQQIATNYNTALGANVSQGVQQASDSIQTSFQADATALGWLGAGSIYMAIARVQSMVSQLSEYAPAVSVPDTGAMQRNGQGWSRIKSIAWDGVLAGSTMGLSALWHTDTPPDLSKNVIQAIEAAKNVIATETGQGPPTPTKFTLQTGSATDGPEVNSGGMTRIADIVAKYAGFAFGGSGPTMQGNVPWLGNVVPVGGFPIADLSATGMNLIKIGASLIVGGGITGAIPLLGSTAGGIMAMIGFAIFAPGIMLGYVLPLLPFIHFLFAVFGWLLALAEAVIEVPIFALAHLDPEGEGVLPGVTRSGYMLLLHLILRPLLIIIGLILSMLLINGMVNFLELVFAATVFSTQTGNSIDIFSEIVYTVIYAAVAYSICNACFKAIDYIPNHALRWIGGQGDMHDSGQHSQLAGAAAMGAAQVGTGIAKAVPQLGADVGRGIGMLAAGIATGGAGAGGGAAAGGASAGMSGSAVGAATGSAASSGSISAPAAAVANNAQLPGDTTGASFNQAVSNTSSTLGQSSLGTSTISSGSTGGAFNFGRIATNLVIDAATSTSKPPPDTTGNNS